MASTSDYTAILPSNPWKSSYVGKEWQDLSSFKASEQWGCTVRLLLDLFWTYKSQIPFFMQQLFQQLGWDVPLASL